MLTKQVRLVACVRFLRDLLSAGVSYHDPRTDRAYRDVEDAIIAVFGADSLEMNDYREILAAYPPPGRNPSDKITYPSDAHVKSIRAVCDLLAYFLRRVNPETADAYDTFDPIAFDMHPRIAGVCVNHFLSGEYRSAVLDACIALQDLVREASECSKEDRATLMQEVFSPKAPLLVFNAAGDRLGASEQEGWMYLFKGAVMAFRNRPAHSLAPCSAEDAVDYITLVNVLAKQLVKAKKAA